MPFPHINPSIVPVVSDKDDRRQFFSMKKRVHEVALINLMNPGCMLTKQKAIFA
jgi:hypothetical protein